MKSLSLTRPLVLVMIGAPGAGKSFFARQFAETFNAPLVSYDQLRSELFAEPTYSKDEDTLISRIAMNELEQLLKTNRTIIVDGGANVKTSRMVIAKMAREADYGTLLIWAQTDEPTSHMRATNRSKRRNGDVYNMPLTSPVFEAQQKRFTPPSPTENYIVISGKHTYATQAKIVLRKLVTPRSEQPLASERPDTSPQKPSKPESNNDPAPRRRTLTIN